MEIEIEILMGVICCRSATRINMSCGHVHIHTSSLCRTLMLQLQRNDLPPCGLPCHAPHLPLHTVRSTYGPCICSTICVQYPGTHSNPYCTPVIIFSCIRVYVGVPVLNMYRGRNTVITVEHSFVHSFIPPFFPGNLRTVRGITCRLQR